MVPGADAVDGAPAGLDPHEVVAQVVELLLDLDRPGLADGDNADHRPDADGNAQHGEDAAHLVAHQGTAAVLEDVEEEHGLRLRIL